MPTPPRPDHTRCASADVNVNDDDASTLTLQESSKPSPQEPPAAGGTARIPRRRVPAVYTSGAPEPAPRPAGRRSPGRRRRHPAPGKASRWTLVTAVVLVILAAGLVTVQLARPVPEPSVRLTLAASAHTFGGPAPMLPWPAEGQAVIDVEGAGVMGSSGEPVPTPTASVAKVMTAYIFLRDRPLASGSQGPSFTVSAQEAARLRMRKGRGESLVDVVAGQPFTQRGALEALMIVSANNIAHEIARWDTGGDAPFVRKMNATARSLGMTGTTYTDPSGYDEGTVSTAADQVKLLRAAMRIPAFAEVAAERAYVPAGGGPARTGGNTLLGHAGVIGGKTGFTTAAGGNYVFAARGNVGGVGTLVVGAVMAQPAITSAAMAVEAGRLLISAVWSTLTAATVAQTGERVAVVDDGLGGRTPLLATAPITVVGWPGLTVRFRADARRDDALPRFAAEGERIGTLSTGHRLFRLVLGGSFTGPPVERRLLRLG